MVHIWQTNSLNQSDSFFYVINSASSAPGSPWQQEAQEPSTHFQAAKDEPSFFINSFHDPQLFSFSLISSFCTTTFNFQITPDDFMELWLGFSVLLENLYSWKGFHLQWFAFVSEIFNLHSPANDDIFFEITLSQSFAAVSPNDVDSEKLPHSHFQNRPLPN